MEFKKFRITSSIIVFFLFVNNISANSDASTSHSSNHSTTQTPTNGVSIEDSYVQDKSPNGHSIEADILQDEKGIQSVQGVTTNGDPREVYNTEPKPSEIREYINESFRQEKKNHFQGMKAYKEYMRTAGAKAEWQKTIWGGQLKRLPNETFMFFLALGVVNTNSLLFKYADNPLVMEQHFKSLEDPLGHISFLAFMVANGYAHHFLDSLPITNRFTSKEVETVFKSSVLNAKIAREYGLHNLTDEEIHKMALKFADGKFVSATKLAYMHMLPFMAMTVGSMASHIVGDFLGTMKACVGTFNGDKSEKGAATTAVAPSKPKDFLNQQSEDPCDVAWREWTYERKYNTYAPALASMMIAQGLSGGVSYLVKEKLHTGLFEGVEKTGVEGAAEQAVKKKLTFKIFSFELLSSITPGGWQARAIGMLGHLTSITLFSQIDNAIHSWVDEIFLNWSYANNSFNSNSFNKKSELLYDLLVQESKNKYQTTNENCVKNIQSYDCRKKDIEGFLYNFSDTMTRWKNFNNSHAMQAHSVWLEKVNNFQSTETAAKSFYGEFVDDLQKTEDYRRDPSKFQKSDYTSNLTKEEEAKAIFGALMEEANSTGNIPTGIVLTTPPMQNYVQYPLFGVIPQLTDENWQNLYLGNPNHLEHAQMETVKKAVIDFEQYVSENYGESGLGKSDYSKIQMIISGLKLEKPIEVGKTINLMKYYANEKNSGVTELTKSILNKYLDKLGRPSPLLFQGQGFTYAFEVNSSYKKLLKDVQLPDFYRQQFWTYGFTFNKKTDYFYYHMLCGPSISSGKIITDKYLNIFGFRSSIPNGMQDLFIPPRLVSDQVDSDICSKMLKIRNSNLLYSQKTTNNIDHKDYSGIFPIIFKNLDPKIQEIVNTTPDYNNQLENGDNVKFRNWWETNVEPVVINKLNEFKDDYQSVSVQFLEALNKKNSFNNEGVVANSLVLSLLQEARVYSLVVAHLIKNSNLNQELINKFIVSDKNLSFTNNGKVDFSKKEDVIRLQLNPLNQDFENLIQQKPSQVFTYQVHLEELLKIYQDTMNEFKIIKTVNAKGKEINAVDLKYDDVKFDVKVEKANDELKKVLEELGKIFPELKEKKAIEFYSKNNSESKLSEKSLRILKFCLAQWQRLTQELEANFNAMNLMSQTVKDYTTKVLSEEQQKLRDKRAKQQERIKKCNNSHNIVGAISSSKCD